MASFAKADYGDKNKSRHGFSPEEVEEFREAFRLFDKDGNAKISLSELREATRSLGQWVTEAELVEMVRGLDEDGNGMIEFDEFLIMMAKKFGVSDPEQDLRETFQVFDKNKDGLINAQDLLYVFTGMGETLTEKEALEMVREADLDGDGFINVEEFIKIMTME